MGDHIQTPDAQIQLSDIELFLREESQNRVIVRSKKKSLFDCLAHSITSSLESLGRARNVQSRLLKRYKESDNIKSSVCELLSKHSKQFQSVIILLVENLSSEEFSSKPGDEQITEFYETVISDCKDGKNLHEYTKLLLYAASTCINTPIYVVCRNEFGRSRWLYFQPLFTYEDQPKSVLGYVTMAMTSEKTFYNVESHDVSGPKPNATGLVGMYIEALQDISPLDIGVPNELLGLSDEQKSILCHTISRDIVLRSCKIFLKRGHIRRDDFDKMIANLEQFRRAVTRSTVAFRIVCQILINRRDQKVLTKFVGDWNDFVTSCEYLRRYASLAALDEAILQRNVSASTFVQNCQLGGQELDERRKAVTTAVIASSSVGIVSGAMVITGIVLAPISFGASLGLSIAGGVIGVGSGVAAGTARTVEAVKQNSKMNDIKTKQANMEKKEENVSNALAEAALLFNKLFRESQDTADIGISKRGFLAVGSAFRAANNIAHIVMAAARLSATAATVAATVLGPLSVVVDIAFLAEAAHNKATGDKTNAGEMLHTRAKSIETKSKIFNDMLRGSWKETERMQIIQARS